MIIITGVSGFVGFNLKTYLKNKNKEILGFSRKPGKYDLDYKEINTKLLNKTNSFIHLAGKAHDTSNNSNETAYFLANTELTKKMFDKFLQSSCETFIYLSSVKAVADNVVGILNEDHDPKPKTPYGKSKLLAERYILSKKIDKNKRVYVLRPCMIHGPKNKGNLNLLYNLVSKRIPWILGSFQNKRSYCSIDNLMFIIYELITNNNIPSGIYNVADDDYLSTNEIITLMFNSNNQKPIILNLSPFIVKIIAKIGDILPLPLNSERLKKLTES